MKNSALALFHLVVLISVLMFSAVRANAQQVELQGTTDPLDYAAGGTPVAIIDDLAITPNSSGPSRATISIDTTMPGDLLEIPSSALRGIAVVVENPDPPGSILLQLQGATGGSRVDWQNALRAVTFRTDDATVSSDRVITFDVVSLPNVTPNNPASISRTLNVLPTPAIPLSISGDAVNIARSGEEYSFTPVTNGGSGATLTFSIDNQPSWANFDAANGTLSGTPPPGSAAHPDITISVTRGSDTVSLAPFTIYVPSGGSGGPLELQPETTNPIVFTSDNTQVRILPFITLITNPNDPATEELVDAVISLGDDYRTGDILAVSLTLGGNFNVTMPSPGNLMLVGTGPVFPTAADFEEALNAVTFATSDTTHAERNITLTVRTFGGHPASVVTRQLLLAGPLSIDISGFPATVVAGQDYELVPVVSGGAPGSTLGFEINPAQLPRWINFDPLTGTLSGTPENSEIGQGLTGIRILVEDGRPTPVASDSFNLEVVDIPPPLPLTLQGRTAPIDHTAGGAPVAVLDDLTITPPTAFVAQATISFAVDSNFDSDFQAGDILEIPPSSLNNISVSPGVGPGSLLLSAVPTANGQPPTVADWETALRAVTFSATGTPNPSTRRIIFDLETFGGSSQATIRSTINVLASPPLSISGDPDTTVASRQGYSFTPTASINGGAPAPGATLTFTIDNPPSWAELDADTGVLSGTPDDSHVGDHTGIVITVTDGTATASLDSFDITVTAAVADVPVLAGSMDIIDYDVSTTPPQPVLPDDFTITASPSLTLESAVVSLGSGFQRGEDLVTAGSIAPIISVSNPNTPGTITLSAPSGATVADWENALRAVAFQSVSSPDRVSTREISVVVTADNGGSSSPFVRRIRLTPVVIISDVLTLVNRPDTTAVVGEMYDFTPEVIGGNGRQLQYSFTTFSPPMNWIRRNGVTGRISGTPSEADVGTRVTIALRIFQTGLDPVVLGPFTITVVEASNVVVANAGVDGQVGLGTTYTLDGSASSGPAGEELTYSWSQTDSGIPVTLDDPTSARPSFTAHSQLTAGDVLEFTLTVASSGQTRSVTVEVTVTPAPLEETSETINQYVSTRTRLVLASQPGLFRRINRLQSGAGVEQLNFATGGLSSLMPVEFNLSGLASGRYAIAASLDQLTRAVSQLQATQGGGHHERRRLDVWFEGNYQKFKGGPGSSGDFAIGFLGVDYLHSPDLLVGGVLQYDSLSESNSSDDSRTDGKGWMAGPSVTTRLQEGLYLDARLAVGRSSNDIRAPRSSVTDSFSSTRWLADISLTGDHSQGGWTIQPNVSLSWLADKQKAYTDSFGGLVPAQTVSQGQFRLGPTVKTQVRASNGWLYEPTLTLDAIYSHAGTSGGLGTALVTQDGWRARLVPSVSMTGYSGIRLSLSGTYDGIGQGDFEAWGLGFGMRMSF